MMKHVLLVTAALVAAVGCSSSPDNGDVETATRAAAAVPKTPDQLPANMPPEARASAASAMQQAAAMQQQAQDPARVRAMQEMQKQSH
jgi:hypothetical protein